MTFALPQAVPFDGVDSYVGRWSVQPKIDGVRCIAILPANRGTVKLLGEDGQEYTNFESVRAKLQEINSRRNPVNTLVLDGEMVSYVNERADTGALQHTLVRKDGKEAGRLRLLVFDGAYEAEWNAPKLPYSKRYDFVSKFIAEQLEAIVGAVTRVGVVPQHVTIDPDRKRMLSNSRQFVEQGYGGAVFRRADIPVELTRSSALLTVKSFMDAQAEVVGTVSGTGKFDGTLGALKCRTQNGKEFEVSMGFTDEQRRALWRARNELPKTLAYRYQDLSEDGIPQFPIFRGFPSP